MFQIDGAAKQMTDVDIDMKGCALNLNYDVYVRNLTVSTTCVSTDAKDTGHLYIGGTYTPVTDYFHNFVMQDGSTLNLGSRSAALNAANLTFAGGTVYIDLGTRKAKSSEPLVSWEEGQGPANVTFELSPNSATRGILEVRKDGLYVQYGMLLIVR